MEYRRDIDGLRAVAVVLVILYHCGFTLVGGGFIGVDVFFVISGFLITELIATNIEGADFSLSRFWMRRVRRLFIPAYVLIAACLVFFWFVYPPQHYRDLAASALAQLAFVSNVLFYFQSGYFDSASHLKPLLHTWSLSIEEQFYLLYPLLLFVCLRLWKRIPVWPLALLTLASFVLSVAMSDASPSGSFFLLPTRAWELGVGCVLALLVRQETDATAPIRPRWVTESAALCGLTAILATSLLFNAETAFPSWRAAIPVVGTAAVIWAGCRQHSLVGSFLGSDIMVAIGLMSYSLYLWHWPAIVAYRSLLPELPTAWGNFAAATAGSVFAWLSFRYIETPIRRRKQLGTDRRLLAAALATLLVIGGVATVIFGSQGMPARALVRYEEPTVSGRVGECFNRFEDGRAVFCRLGPAKPVPDFVAIGDSHNRALLPALEFFADRHGMSGLFASTSGCLPVRGVSMTKDPKGSERCRRIVEGAYGMVGDAPGKVPRIILTARWSYYTDRAPDDGSFRPVSYADVKGDAPETSRLAFARAWRDSMAELRRHGAKVFVVEQAPRQYFYPADVAWRAAFLHMDRDAMALTSRQNRIDQGQAKAIINSDPYATIIQLEPVFCSTGRCIMFDGSKTLYLDEGHLSAAGALKVEPAISAAVLNPARSP